MSHQWCIEADAVIFWTLSRRFEIEPSRSEMRIRRSWLALSIHLHRWADRPRRLMRQLPTSMTWSSTLRWLKVATAH